MGNELRQLNCLGLLGASIGWTESCCEASVRVCLNKNDLAAALDLVETWTKLLHEVDVPSGLLQRPLHFGINQLFLGRAFTLDFMHQTLYLGLLLDYLLLDGSLLSAEVVDCMSLALVTQHFGLLLV